MKRVVTTNKSSPSAKNGDKASSQPGLPVLQLLPDPDRNSRLKESPAFRSAMRCWRRSKVSNESRRRNHDCPRPDRLPLLLAKLVSTSSMANRRTSSRWPPRRTSRWRSAREPSARNNVAVLFLDLSEGRPPHRQRGARSPAGGRGPHHSPTPQEAAWVYLSCPLWHAARQRSFLHASSSAACRTAT